MARKILLADDSVTAQNMGRKILADAGYEVVTVNNGSAALKKIADLKPDLIVLDVYMPGYSGLEVCQRLKEASETSRTPVLLTVGKLEPFKPEEAKRVRADGFIVKPFEASELLSALSKLEDKIVPRPEASKPGRFARANAAIDEGRYDKTMAADEDSGWKNRIGFPSGKKKAAEPEDVDESAIYNAVNKDLRTVVDRKPMPEPVKAQEPPRSQEHRVDLGALAPEGLPKDVTAEEIAALAAAAAQVKGKLAESHVAEITPQVTVAAVAAASPVAHATVEAWSEAKTAEIAIPVAEIEHKPVPMPEVRLALEAQPEPAMASVEQKPEENVEASPVVASTLANAPSIAASSLVPPSVETPTPADVVAAIAGLESWNSGSVSQPTSSGNGSGSHGVLEEPADEPVTMALAAGAESVATVSRWTAVSVALAPEEAGLTLEHEMQKAYAAFAAAEVGHVAVATAISQAPVSEPEPVSPSENSLQVAGDAPSIVPMSSPAQTDVASSVSTASTDATDAISAAVMELEAVAASYVEAQKPAVAEPEPAPREAAEAVSHVAPEIPQAVEVAATEIKAEENAVIEAAPSPIKTTKEVVPEPALESAPEPASEERHLEAQKSEARKSEEQKSEEQESDEPMPVAATLTAEAELPSAPDAQAPPTALPEEPAVGGIKDMGKKESEIAETTAAAWASWRRIREPADSKAPIAQSAKPSEVAAAKVIESEPPASQESAAMAVAAGAEKAPEDGSPASEPESADIASIVDSMLADLRPKIVEEITRKMGKKK